MDQNVVVLSFAEASKAYQALSELKAAGVQERVHVETAAVVAREADGRLVVKDGASDGEMASGPLTGTLLGAVIGLLAGPLGMLLGGMSGAVIGSSVSLDKVQDRLSMIDQMMRAMPVGSTSLIAVVQESSAEAVDQLAAGLQGTVLRRPLAAVQAEVDAQSQAHEAASREARRVLHEQQKDEWQGKFDNWKEELGEGLDRLQARIAELFGGRK
ncbi:DUF1269 domain-containing protein [Comamonas humi]